MEENKLITLKLVDFNATETRNLDSILTLAERSLNKTWKIVETETADFFLLSINSSKSINDDAVLQQLPRQQCLFCIADDQPYEQNKNFLPVNEHGLPSLSILVKLFNQLSEQEKATSDAQVPPALIEEKINSADEISFFDFEKGFLGHLLNSKNDMFTIELTNKPDYSPIYINDAEASYYSRYPLDQLEDYVIATENLSIKPCSKIELKSYLNAENLKAQSLKDLIWYATIKTSAGKVIRGYSSDDIITLKKWPDLRLPHCLDYAKLATFMKNNAATLQIISEQTQFPLTKIYPFYNACYLIGLIELKFETDLNQKNIDTNRLSLLAQIETRLEK